MSYSIKRFVLLLICIGIAGTSLSLFLWGRNLVRNFRASDRWADSFQYPCPYDPGFEKFSIYSKLYHCDCKGPAITGDQASVLLDMSNRRLRGPWNLKVPGCRIVFLAQQPEDWVYRGGQLNRNLCTIFVTTKLPGQLWHRTLLVTVRQPHDLTNIVCPIDGGPVLESSYSQHWWTLRDHIPVPSGPRFETEEGVKWIVWRQKGDYQSWYTLLRGMSVRTQGYVFNQIGGGQYVCALALREGEGTAASTEVITRYFRSHKINSVGYPHLPYHWFLVLTEGRNVHAPSSDFSARIVAHVRSLNDW